MPASVRGARVLFKESKMKHLEFRAKAKFNGNNKFKGDWVYGCLLYDLDPHTVNDVIVRAWIKEPLVLLSSTYEVDVETIGQSVGVKDRKGKMIYQGDIVNSWDSLETPNDVYLREVVRNDESNQLEFKPATGFVLCHNASKHFRVVGNVFDDKDLIV